MLTLLKSHVHRWIAGATPPEPTRTSVLDHYVRTAPSSANVLALFQNQWISKLPAELGFPGGGVNLFDDARMHWLLSDIEIAGKTVLELGPLEAGHTAHLCRAGAAEVTAIEAHAQAYLRCLAIKETMGLTNARFLLGDFVEFLRQREHSFDVCVASGVLYHMQNPVELLELLANACRKHLFLWTHYFDAEAVAQSPDASAHLKTHQSADWKGFQHTLIRYDYDLALASDHFCGGSAPHSSWLSRPDILAALVTFGFNNIRVAFDEPNHPHGPALALIASR